MTSAPLGLAPLPGGWSGETFVSEVAGERSVVRIYSPTRHPVRSALAPEIDAAVHALVRGLLPVPEVLEVRRPDAQQDLPGLLVTSWVSGERGDLLLAHQDDAGLALMGRAMGHAAATLAGMPTLHPGPFLGPELSLGVFPDGGLAEWVEHRLVTWTDGDRARLLEVVESAQDLLDSIGRSSVVHSDLNPKNVLFDPETRAITGIVDWEYAHSGHPWTDLGNVLRFDRQQPYVDAALEAWAGLRGGEPETLVEGARAADLWALTDLASGAGDNPVARRADRLLRVIAETGDVHAWPQVC